MGTIYSLGEFSKAVNVPKKTLRLWNGEGRLCYHDTLQGKYYTEKEYEIVKGNFGKPLFGKKEVFGDDWVDYSEVPKERFTGRYDWKLAAQKHSKIEFYCAGQEGVLEVIGSERSGITVLINGEEKTLSRASLLRGDFLNLIGRITSDYRYDINQRIINDKADVLILDRGRKKTNGKKEYKYRCMKCGNTDWVEEYYLKDNTGICNVCYGTKVVKGINDIGTTDPWMLKFLPDASIAYFVSRGSGKSFRMICPICGRTSPKKMAIKTLYRTRSIGCPCDDGYSYPNKFMYNVLEQLKQGGKIHDFQREWSPSWLKRRAFDFNVTIQECSRSIVIEMDGTLGHGRNTMPGHTREKDIAIDRWKDEQARKHKVCVIRIDALISNQEELKDNILHSTVGHLMDMTGIDWNEADVFATSSLVLKVCHYYNRNSLTIDDLAKVFGISRSTALRYINKGEGLGWCHYNNELLLENRQRSSKQGAVASCKPVNCYTVCGKFVRTYDSLKEAADDVGVSDVAIGNCCKGKSQKSAGFIWRYMNEVYLAGNNIIVDIKPSKRGMPVDCFTLNGEYIQTYRNAMEAVRLVGTGTNVGIGRCCRGLQKTSGGYVWKYTKTV